MFNLKPAALGAAFLGSAATMAFTATSAQALTMRLTASDDGGTATTTVTGSPIPGGSLPVSYVGALGDLILDISTGATKPFTGSVELPGFNLNSQNFTTGTTPATLKVELTETGFTSATAALNWALEVSGNSSPAGNAEGVYSLFADGDNDEFGTDVTLLASSDTYTTNYADEITGSYDSSLLDGTPFSVTLVLDISQAAGTSSQLGANLNSAVPEPLTILGAGTAIAFGGAFKRKLGKQDKKESTKA